MKGIGRRCICFLLMSTHSSMHVLARNSFYIIVISNQQILQSTAYAVCLVTVSVCQDPSNFSGCLDEASLPPVLHLTLHPPQSERNNNASIKHTLIECSSQRAARKSYGGRSDSCLRAHSLS
ncbi:hypothetical protein ACJQWK_07132 [Exserohilum turcicum]